MTAPDRPNVVAAGLARPAVPPGLRAPLTAVATGGCVSSTAVGLTISGSAEPLPADDALLAAAGGPIPDLQRIARFVDFLGEPAGVLLLGGILVAICLLTARWRLAALTVLGQGAAAVTSAAAKPLVGREIHGEFLAYPSGHTAGATAFALVVGLLLVRRGRAADLLVVLGVTAAAGLVAGWAQTVLVAHYATDALGGFLLALGIVPLLALLVDAAAGCVVRPVTADPGRASQDRAARPPSDH